MPGTILKLPSPMAIEAEFELLCSALVDTEITQIKSRFEAAGMNFNVVAFTSEARGILDELVRTSLFYGADLNLNEAVSALKSRRLISTTLAG